MDAKLVLPQTQDRAFSAVLVSTNIILLEVKNVSIVPMDANYAQMQLIAKLAGVISN